MNKKLATLARFFSNSLKICELGLTNICTCQCSFCNIWKQKPKVMLKKEDALFAVDKLADLGVGVIALTGGEPILHPNIADIVKRCNKRGIITTLLNADARLITEEKVKAFKKEDLDFMSISVDHYDNKVEYKSRKIPNLLNHVKNAVDLCKKYKIKTSASVVICNYNHDCLKKLFDKINELGFDVISINYPEMSLSPVYCLGGEAIKLTKKDLIKSLEEVIRLKKAGYPIINQTTSMKDIIRYLKNEKVKFPCLGGYRVLFVDWFLDVYPCMHLPNKLGNLKKFSKKSFKKIPCNQCNMSWYRDFSIYFQGSRSLPPLMSLTKDLKYMK